MPVAVLLCRYSCSRAHHNRGHVEGAGCVAPERKNTIGGVGAAICVARERKSTRGRVVACTCQATERTKTHGCVVAAAVVWLTSASKPSAVLPLGRAPSWPRAIGESAKHPTTSGMRSKPSRKGERLIEFLISGVVVFVSFIFYSSWIVELH